MPNSVSLFFYNSVYYVLCTNSISLRVCKIFYYISQAGSVISALDKAHPNLPENTLPPKQTVKFADDDMEKKKVVRLGVNKPESEKNAPKSKVSLSIFYM
jgi:hypothetical protein